MARKFLLLMMLFFSAGLSAQNGELGKQDCSHSKEILIPFGYSPDPQNPSTPLLDQRVFYSFRDQFSFWYRVDVKEDVTLNFKVKAINDSDAYSVIVYNYNLPDVCDKIYYRKIEPVKQTFFIGKGSDKFPDQNEKSFKAKKGNVYHINVLNTSLNNCGHRLWLCYGKDTLKVEAIHLPCKRDISSLSLKKSIKDTVLPMRPTAIETNTVKPEIIKPVELVTAFFARVTVLNKKNQTPMDGKLTVIEKSSAKQVFDVNPLGNGAYEVMMEENKMYSVKCEALGFKTENISVNANEAKILGQKILMEPLQKGESFVLKSIYFVPNTYALRKESLGEMEKLLAFMKNNPETVIEIQGHTNGDNKIYKNKAYASLSEEWNFSGSSQKLSQKRAEVIKNYLMHNGIDQKRIVAKGYGGSKALIKYPETNDEAQRNIRVEVALIND